jgi:hypothetical protein
VRKYGLRFYYFPVLMSKSGAPKLPCFAFAVSKVRVSKDRTLASGARFVFLRIAPGHAQAIA